MMFTSVSSAEAGILDLLALMKYQILFRSKKFGIGNCKYLIQRQFILSSVQFQAGSAAQHGEPVPAKSFIS